MRMIHHVTLPSTAASNWYETWYLVINLPLSHIAPGCCLIKLQMRSRWQYGRALYYIWSTEIKRVASIGAPPPETLHNTTDYYVMSTTICSMKHLFAIF